MTGVSKEFPGVRALSEVDFELLPGEIHALLGENGAGKSTLIKVLTGVYQADAGEIELDGRGVRFTHPAQAQQAGISTVYQEVNLCPNLSVAENIFIGTSAGRNAVRWNAMHREAEVLLERLGLRLDVRAPLGEYPLAIQQLVAIVRAVRVDAKVLILDEPTSSLDRGEVEQLFAVMRRLRDQGVAILFVSHFLEQIYEICDRMTVLRNGRVVGTHPVASLGREALVRLMIGKELAELEELQHDTNGGAVLVQAQGLGRRGAIAPFDLQLRSHEVTGLAGLLLTLGAMLVATIPPSDTADPFLFRLKVIGGATAFVLIGGVVYWRGRRRPRPAAGSY